MFPFIPSSLLLVLLLAAPALLTPSTSHELQVRGQRTPRDAKQDSVRVVISESFLTQGDSSDVSQGGREINLIPGSPLVLTHKIKLVPSGSGSGSCGCEADFAALRERLERLEREVSSLREKCGGAEGGCCTSKESKGAGCSIKPKTDECPNECSDQGRCVDGKCVCFPGFSGPDCSESNCPGNCNDNGRCVNGQCVCDPGFAGADCSQRGCPDNCNDHGRCVNGKCVCDSGFAGPSCSDKSCPGNCNNRGRCVNGQCVCNPGFTGTDCSEKSCPGNCNNKGRCVNGQCACNPGFTGPDCSKRACPDNCNNRGRCVNGKCVCDSGFTGADCSEDSCPGNCNNKGRCVDGECVCDDGFGGPDCSERTCPDDCSDRGRCVNGKCVCDSGFTGDDCSEASCPGNCNSRGRCVNGQCVCDAGFTGDDCSEASCPGNCNNKGRCVNGRCVCDSGFTGDDCSEASCPGNCNNKGRCLKGRCVCDAGFTGDDCSEASCPGNCNKRGRCVNGLCVCNAGFTGDDCSEKACPKNCSNHGKCANGKCVCEVGFAGPDCSAKGCPGNCNNKGRCVKGKCVCRRGFTGPDCSQCEEGRTGANCDTVMSGVTRLSTRDITETSVTLLWTQPRVQYDTYYITFTSQKESDQQISVQVEGSLTSFTQTGLAAGQDYTVSITGEIDGRKGAETSAEFMTLISGPANLRVVKTTSTSAVVQWEQSQGEIDRYRLTVTPSDGAGRSQEMTVPAGQDSAELQQLEAGRLYDITLVAEKGTSRSKPATTQVTPGPEPPTDIVFSELTENSLTVSWTKPKTSISGFKVTYTHAEEGEPVSVSVDSDDSTVDLSQLSPGSSYEVSVLSVLGLDESDPIKDFVMTLPDPPTHLRTLNVTDTKALLLWRPALAAVDKYAIVYGSGTDSELRVTVSGNAAEQQLSDLEGSTTYTVTITSQLGGVESSAASTSFTTAGGSGSGGDGPSDLQANNVSPRTALLSWKPPANPASSYRLTYQTEGQEMKEVIVDASLTEYNLTRLHPGSEYTVQLQAEGGGRYTDAISTDFTTGTLRFPFPTDCSQELLNGIRTSGEVEIFPQGKLGTPIMVSCDMETDGGGWTVFQRRKDGSVNFFRGWKDYTKGFGSPSGEFWLGLESLYNLTAMTKMTLRVDLRDKDEAVYAKYSTFELLKRNYKLNVGGYSGTAGDSLSYHSQRIFSTKDRDLSPFITRCAMSYRGGWWYKNCHEANLNGLYGTNVNHQGVIWTAWKGKQFSIPFTEMKMRPAAFSPPTAG
ncbi:tenascin isoform X2 [Sebastes fasciatus]|uniref:tenascin isoform X2 n=1 Tax=Sebastes fasciatus TaxID=394691 RepID=UPI003D9F8F2C